MAKITELIPGRDGEISTVKLKTQYGTVLCPLQRLYPLEIRTNENWVTEKVAGEGESNSKRCSNVMAAPNDVIKKYTSSGRCVKTPNKLDLFNYVVKGLILSPNIKRGGGGEDVVEIAVL
ncbi:DUF5641 domain-containing protein [Trichonephila clavata]|uniref:DUF5641 domain-containing protein n=1 Tax=Trichonephila clavata TaxID=2740835 RepID=A0A8X6IR16_TRICU|nr:DUF5641 domain-containing protein [Trichonephila clavata]